MRHRVVVLGAGYTGAHTAGRLARRLHPADTAITVVNADPHFVQRIRLHQLAAGQLPRRRALRDIFGNTPVTVRPARVAAVDLTRRTVTLTGGDGPDEIGWDTLVYALGSTATDHGVPGVAAHAHQVCSEAGALRLRDRLRALGPGARVLVAGGGLTGLEVVTEIAESRPELDVAFAVRGAAGDWLGDRARHHLNGVLDRLGVTVHEHTDVTAVDASGVRTAAGSVVPADVTVWATGFGVHPIAAASGLRVAVDGRIVVDATMRSVSHPDVYAVGDAALADGPGGRPLRMSCASGVPMAWQAADSLAARLTGRPVPANTIRYFNQCISLGRRDGIIQPVTADDRALPTAIVGRTAARLKEFVCAGAAWSTAHPTLLLPVARRHVTAETARVEQL